MAKSKAVFIKVKKRGFFKITGSLLEPISITDIVRVLMAIKPGSYTISLETIKYALDHEEEINKKFIKRNEKI